MDKAQVAMEYLMSYGWALLVIILAVAASVYFGIFGSSEKFLPESCLIKTGLSCDLSASENQVTLSVQNGVGDDIIVREIGVGECIDSTFSTKISYLKKEIFTLTCSLGSSGESIREDLYITYSIALTGIEKTHDGKLTTTII